MKKDLSDKIKKNKRELINSKIHLRESKQKQSLQIKYLRHSREGKNIVVLYVVSARRIDHYHSQCLGTYFCGRASCFLLYSPIVWSFSNTVFYLYDTAVSNPTVVLYIHVWIAKDSV
jgi:hypothetical protein